MLHFIEDKVPINIFIPILIILICLLASFFFILALLEFLDPDPSAQLNVDPEHWLRLIIKLLGLCGGAGPQGQHKEVRFYLMLYE
jgi:hypothetical protein